MLLTIYDSTGGKKAAIEATDSSTQVKEIGSDNILNLTFTLYEHVILDVNDYVYFEGERYWLTERYKPAEKNRQEWEYNVKLQGIESLVKRFLVLNMTDGANDPVFTLTAPAREHVAMIVECINGGMGTTDWKVGEVVETDNITLDYEGTYCNEGLKMVAEAADTEWWIDGMTVNVCRCETGEELTLGYGKGLLNIEPDTADNVKLYTRLFPIGSSRNIEASRYGHTRLQLPDGAKYVDINTDKYGIIHHYEQEAFSGIYPRRTGTVSSVRSEEVTDEDGEAYTIYYFKDDTLDFDPNDYEIAGETKRVSFQEGSELAGLGTGDDHYFEVNFDSESREMEIITIWPYDNDMQLPGGQLVPKAGDRYILWNINMPEEYYAQAEAELLEAAKEYNAEHGVDATVFKCQTDHVWVEEKGAELYLGRRVRIESSEYFPETGYRESRITKISRKVNLPGQMDLEISDVVSKGSMESIEDSIGEIKNIVRTGGSGSSIAVIRSWEHTPASDYNVYSAKRTLKEIATRALSRLGADEARGLIKFLAGAEFGEYSEGLSGAKIDADGNAEFGSLVTRLKAILAELQVNGDAELRGNLSSEEFVSGFLTGKGWAITKKEVLNALGIAETKYAAEFDEVIVRGALRVYEMIISQLLGENDNRVFTGMMEVDHYDTETGRVYLDTQDGKMYNPFRTDDYIMVQQYGGMPTEENDYYVTKHYEMVITAAGCGNQTDGEARLDWVEFKNFVSADGRDAADVIAKGDTLVRVDNASDPDRKGLMQAITVGATTPYLDVAYGMKTDPDDSLKVRIGNLQGIYHHLFGWLQGFGAYLANIYAVGDFRLRQTGANLDSQVVMTKNLFATQYQNLRYEMTEEENYLYNATFDETMDGWTTDDEGMIITSNGEALLMNGNIYISDGKIASIEQLDGRNVLHLKGSYIRQANALIKQPGTHKEYVTREGEDTSGEYEEVKDTLYLSVRFLAQSGGLLTIGMEGSKADVGTLPAPTTVEVESSLEWQTMQWSGTWDGAGDFVLEYEGEMYVSTLSLTGKPLEEYKKETSTKIEQTDEYISLSAERITANENSYAQLKITADEISSTVENNKRDADGQIETCRSQIKQTAESITQTVENYKTELDGTITTKTSELRQDMEGISTRVTEAQDTADGAVGAYSTLSQTVGKIATEVSGKCDQATYTEGKKAIDKAIKDAQDAADAASQKADDNLETAKTYTNSQIEQTDKRITAVAGKVTLDANGNVTNIDTSGFITTSNYATLFSQQVDAQGLVKKAALSTCVQYDPSTGKVTSNINLTADKISLEGYTTVNKNFTIDEKGNMTATNGTLSGTVTATAGKIGNFTISSNGWLKAPSSTAASGESYFCIGDNTVRATTLLFGPGIEPGSAGQSVRTAALIRNATPADEFYAGNAAIALRAEIADAGVEEDDTTKEVNPIAARRYALEAKGFIKATGGVSYITTNFGGRSLSMSRSLLPSTSGWSDPNGYKAFLNCQNEFVFQHSYSNGLVVYLPTTTEICRKLIEGGYPQYDGAYNENPMINSIYHLTFTNIRYSEGSLYVRGTSDAPLARDGASNHLNVGSYQYGQYVIDIGFSASFTYFNRSWYLRSIGKI